MRIALSLVARSSSFLLSAAALLSIACHESTAPPAATRLAFTGQPTSAVAMTAWNPIVTVVILDAEGDTVKSGSYDISIAIGNNPGGAALFGVTTVRATDGVAKFPDVTINKVGSGYTLVATATNLVSANSNPFSVENGPTAKLVFTVQPVSTIARTPIPPFSVTAQDAAGNSVTNATVQVTLTGPPQLTGTLTRPTQNGVATFSDVTIPVPGTGFVLRASAPGGMVAFALSSQFNMTVGPAAKLTFSVQPIVTAPGAVMPSVSAIVTDAGGNPVSTPDITATISLGDNPAGGTLTGTLTRTLAGGVVTFGDLRIDRQGSGYTLMIAVPSLSNAVSRKFSIRNGIVFKSISAGYFHTCGVAEGGTVYCWGSNTDGQLGDTAMSEIKPAPDPVTGGNNFVSVGAGRTHNCGIYFPGSAQCWGLNQEGQLGVPGFIKSTVPLGVSEVLSFKDAIGGYSHSCGVTVAGAGYCWGDNSSGALGNGTVDSYSSPTPVTGGLVFLSISPGRFFTCGVATSRAAYCWGDNSSGELGDNTVIRRLTPTPVAGSVEFSFVGAGGFSACGLDKNGAAYCWGSNASGTVGDGTRVNRLMPVAVTGGLTFAMLSVGNRHVCGITQAGIAYCWGDNSDGNLGDGSTISSSIPTRVSGNLIFKSISAGRFHSCGLTIDGAAYCWGANGSGQLGDGTTVGRFVPGLVR